jgi:DNA-binding transcriptional MerR regulator
LKKTLEFDSKMSYYEGMNMNRGNDDPSFSIGELAQRAGVSRRTVRYYVQRGLIDPPRGLGRASAYSLGHVEQIRRVLRLQREGCTLQNILSLPEGKEPESLPKRGLTSLVLRVQVIPGVWLEVEAGASLPEPGVIEALAEACSRILEAKGEGVGGDPGGGAPKEKREETDHG